MGIKIGLLGDIFQAYKIHQIISNSFCVLIATLSGSTTTFLKSCRMTHD